MGSVWSDETKELATDIRQVREQVVCLQRVPRKIRYPLDLSVFQRARKPEAVPKSERLRQGIHLDDARVRESEWKSGDDGHGCV
jgi:hypothetical protein